MSVYIKSDNKGKKRSDTPTPIWLCDFLHNILSVKEYPTILDCCAGDKRLTNNFKNSNIINSLRKIDKILNNTCIPSDYYIEQ